jgi:hypothetical protein
MRNPSARDVLKTASWQKQTPLSRRQDVPLLAERREAVYRSQVETRMVR